MSKEYTHLEKWNEIKSPGGNFIIHTDEQGHEIKEYLNRDFDNFATKNRFFDTLDEAKEYALDKSHPWFKEF